MISSLTFRSMIVAWTVACLPAAGEAQNFSDLDSWRYMSYGQVLDVRPEPRRDPNDRFPAICNDGLGGRPRNTGCTWVRLQRVDHYPPHLPLVGDIKNLRVPNDVGRTVRRGQWVTFVQRNGAAPWEIFYRGQLVPKPRDGSRRGGWVWRLP